MINLLIISILSHLGEKVKARAELVTRDSQLGMEIRRDAISSRLEVISNE